MTISQMLLPEFEMEMAKTRTAIERVPMDKLAWKPHEKSMTLGHLAGHLAEIPGWGALTINQDTFDIAPPGAPPYAPPAFTTSKQFLDLFDKNVGSMRAALAGASDETLGKPWSLLKSGTNIFTMPRVAVLRNMIMNHNIHHRAQLGVYFRLSGVPVPSTYGPSADEGNM
jgi:uncharacterized damage-inducible protein DinB